MSEIEFEKKYRERYVRWSEKTRDQLSFFNNLLLTFSIGFLSFVLTQEKYSENLEVPFIIENAFIISSVILILLSVLVGLLLVINRIYDFRITSHINQVRHWTFMYSNGMELSNRSSINYKCFHRLVLSIKVITKNFDKIKFHECEKLNSKSDIEIEQFFQKFEQLRAISHNLGIATWTNLKWQIGLFLLSIICFVASHFSI